MKLLEDRVEVFTSMGSENISGKINKFLEDNAIQIEKVIVLNYQHPPFWLPVKRIN